MSRGRDRPEKRDRLPRELSKSMLCVPWAVSMFGVRQAARRLDPHSGRRRAAPEVDAASDLIEDQLGDRVGGLYLAGKYLQEGLVDALFDLAGGTWAGSETTLARPGLAVDRSRMVAGSVDDRQRATRQRATRQRATRQRATRQRAMIVW